MPTLTGPITNQPARLPKGEVHVWHTNLAGALEDPSGALDLLDLEERARAARLRSDADRAQFIVAHGIIRILLASYLGCTAHAVRFGCGPRGKPYVVRSDGHPDLCFNASRTSDLAIFAIAAEREVGIDAETITSDGGLTDALAQALSGRERTLLADSPSEIERYTEYLKAWARKEAFLKARGDGLAVPPAEVCTETASGMVYLRGRIQPGWRVYDISVGDGYSAAVAAEGEHWHVVLRRYSTPNLAMGFHERSCGPASTLGNW